ncbi:MerR family transcriptional regulator [Actinoplanes flavus]|uniref:MerR family transcriptional regulator n=1 Tax=Actinoplanes flavus TaxID=2820290 RepID=A0ABS3UZW2_9ACTN|nr:MerR family transcriptional regulator [Actinoplanes flavus]MBO3744121.1 MerR family transcriptional regulator [Actinoplanes flavus]
MGDEGLSAGAAARRLGVAVTTLRTWHQRYGLGPSVHQPGHHRRYTAEDMVRLQVMQRLTAQGVAPAEAAAWACRSPSADAPPASPSPSEPAGGGQTIALGKRADPTARGLARAAMRLDAPAMRHLLESTIADRGVVAAWNHVMLPVLIGIGERYEATERFVEVEHLLSRSITEALSTVPRPSPELVPRVLLAAADEEQHTLPLEALAAALAENGVPSRLLGARVPPRALLDAVDRTGPTVVVLWSQVPATGDVVQLDRLLAVPRPPLLIGAAGPGWPDTSLPPSVTRLTGLTGAVRTLRDACA